MKKRRYKSYLWLPVFFVLAQCKNNGDIIAEPRFGTYNFSTYTIDSFRFRVVLNGEVLTDSLLSPIGLFSQIIPFYKAEGRLKIFDAKNNDQLVLDSVIAFKTGTTNIAIIQLDKSIEPSVPERPNEGPPASGKYKIRFQYVSPVAGSAVPYFDTVKCIIRLQDLTGPPPDGYRNIDTVVLNPGELTRFYEASSDLKFRIKLLRYNNAAVFNQTGPVIALSTSPSDFNTAIIKGEGTQAGSNGPYLYEIRKVY